MNHWEANQAEHPKACTCNRCNRERLGQGERFDSTVPDDERSADNLIEMDRETLRSIFDGVQEHLRTEADREASKAQLQEKLVADEKAMRYGWTILALMAVMCGVLIMVFVMVL